MVKAWLETNSENIRVFYLPAYSPELNPTKYLNCDLKTGVHTRLPPRNQKDLEKSAISHLRKLQKLPKRIIKYFEHPKISYAT